MFKVNGFIFYNNNFRVRVRMSTPAAVELHLSATNCLGTFMEKVPDPFIVVYLVNQLDG